MPALPRPLALLPLLALLAACAPQDPPFTVAVVGPMRGPFGSLGGQMRAGVEQAEQDLDAHGGVLGRALKFRGVDDQCDAKLAPGIASALVAEKVSLVVGHFCSTSAVAAAPVYSGADVLMITPSASSAALTDDAAARGSSNIFRLVPRDDMQGTGLAEHILAHYPGAAVALVDDDTPYGKNVVISTRQALAAKGVHAALSETLQSEQSDFAALVERLKARGIGVIVFGGYAEEGAKLLVAVRRQGLEAAFGGGDTLIGGDFLKRAGANAEGTFMTSLPDLSGLPEAQHAIAGLTAFGLDAKGYTLYAYAALDLYAQAAERAKSLDPAAIAKALREGAYDTVLGKVSFDAKGDNKEAHYALYVWQQGEVHKL